MTPDPVAFLLNIMRAGTPLTVTPEPSRTNGSCRCGDCGAP